ncbi:MAG: excinuclease ABC subunit UvrC [Candidatus Latescibacterota bacterium]
MTPKKQALREKAALLPTRPGIYMFLDALGKVLYVGKAKSLRTRVLSYFREDGDGRAQIPWLMRQAVGLDYIVTNSEIEALVTEANLARSRKPKFNVRLKDDKSYPYIKVTKESAPRIYLTRTVVDDGSQYLGPYTDVKAVRKILDLVHSLFPIRSCVEKLPSKRLDRACLDYQIRRCGGPCVGYMSLEEYNRFIQDAVRFIQGHNDDLIRDLEERMHEASEALNFERAAQLRDTVSAIRKMSERRKAFSTERLTGDWDVVNYSILDTEACVVIMEMRDGAILGKKDYLMSGVQYSSPPEMLSAFLTQYYLRVSWIPPEIHLPAEPEDAETVRMLLEERRQGKMTFVYPQRGEKARLLRMTGMNAETIIKKTVETRDRYKDAVPSTLLALMRDLHLGKPPRTIACIDISHFQGSDTVASLVFFRNAKPEKKEYRHFKIETVGGVDDFASMREVVERYFTRRINEEKELPDLLLVDGGKGQLSSARGMLVHLGLKDQEVAGLAKRLEEVFLPGASEAQNISKTSSSIHLLQRIRDEAHRFAVTYHRKLREKRTLTSSLTQIKGIGPKMAGDLLRHFGSVSAVRAAKVEEIAAVPGIGEKRAQTIFAQLHAGEGGGDSESTEGAVSAEQR